MEEQRNQQRPAEMKMEQRNQLKPAEMEKEHQQERNQIKPAEMEKEQQQRQQQEEEEDKPREKRREHEQSLQTHSVPIPTPSSPPSVNTQSSESYKDPKRRSPSSDSPLSSDNFSLSHGSSPRGPPPSQPSYPSSLPPVVTVVDVKVGSESPDFVEDEEKKVNPGSGRRLRPDLSILRRTKREMMVKRILLGFRTCGFACCLVAFSVLAADRDQGWDLDSFYRYREFRYSMAVNVIGFVYSTFQAYDLAYGLATSKQKTRPRLRYYLDFSLDQMISYLLLSASSSAAVRVDDWQSNWGKDKFPDMAKSSVALSFIAFISMALSSVISGYRLCTFKSI